MKRSNITVFNLNRAYKINDVLIKRLAALVLKAAGSPITTELEIVFLDDDKIRKLNKRYKDSDKPTDVLSFAIEGLERGSKEFLGEIIISIDRAKANSARFSTDFREELVLYVIHGILHLFGYDDQTLKKARIMSEKQAEILKDICKKEDLSRVLTPL